MPAPIQDLKKHLPKLSEMADSAYTALGGIPRDARLAQILDQFWPECYVSALSGKTIMAPEDARLLEELFKMFGVPMTVADNGLEIMGRAYDVFAVGLVTYVNQKLYFPTKMGVHSTFRESLADWDADWVTYLEAVAAEDFEVARHYAKKLQVLDPDCVYPPGVFIEPAKKPGLTDENKPAKNEPLRKRAL